MPNPTARSFLGIAKEATKGTFVAATDYIPVKTFTPQDHYAYLEDVGMRGSMSRLYGEVQGASWSEYEFTGDVFSDTIGYPLGGLFGSLDFTAGPPNQHNFALKNTGDGQPLSYSITDYDSFNARAYTGSQFEEITFRFNADGLLEYTAKAKGFASATQTAPTASFSTLQPYPNWRGAVSIAGGAITTNMVTAGELTMKRPVNPIHAVDGTQAPYKIWAGEFDVSGRVTMVLDDETEYTRYLGSSGSTTTQAFVIDWTQGSAGTAEEVRFTATKAVYTLGKIVRGKDYVELEVDIACVANATDIGTAGAGSFAPCRVLLKNAKATGTFT